MHLGGLVARNKRTVPDKEAIIFQDKRYTWAEVDDRVNTVAKPGVVGELAIKGETTTKECYENPQAAVLDDASVALANEVTREGVPIIP